MYKNNLGVLKLCAFIQTCEILGINTDSPYFYVVLYMPSVRYIKYLILRRLNTLSKNINRKMFL